MNRKLVVWLREIDAGTDNACWVVCAKNDLGSRPFVCVTEWGALEAAPFEEPQGPNEANDFYAAGQQMPGVTE